MHCNRFVFTIGLLLAFTAQAHASSTIINGVVETYPGGMDGKVAIRATHSPYCSEGPLSKLLTHRTGHYATFDRRLSEYKIVFIDEVPVTHEQAASVLKPGMRATMFMNRKNPYFLRLETRNPGSRVGFLTGVSEDGQTATLSSPQHSHGAGRVRVIGKGDKHLQNTFVDPKDGVTTFSDKHYPPNQYELVLTEDTQVIAVDGAVSGTGAEAVKNVLKKPVFYLPGRKVQRVELLPENYGDWSLTHTKAFLGNRPEMRASQMGVMLSKDFGEYKIALENEDGTPKTRKNANRWVITGKSYSMFRLLGNDQVGERKGETYHGVYEVPLYGGGHWNILDGYYTLESRYGFNHLLFMPGKFVVSTARRVRITPDSIMSSTEIPSAWGAITSVEGNILTIEAPEIEGVPVSGKQTIQIADNAETVKLGLAIERAEALKVGAIVKVFEPHPARIYLGVEKAAPEKPVWGVAAE